VSPSILSPVSQDLITSRDIIPFDLASTCAPLSPDAMLELIFRHLLVDFPFVIALFPLFFFVHLPFHLAVSVETPSLVRVST
jgi:hypothetical protein